MPVSLRSSSTCISCSVGVSSRMFWSSRPISRWYWEKWTYRQMAFDQKYDVQPSFVYLDLSVRSDERRDYLLIWQTVVFLWNNHWYLFVIIQRHHDNVESCFARKLKHWKRRFSLPDSFRFFGIAPENVYDLIVASLKSNQRKCYVKQNQNFMHLPFVWPGVSCPWTSLWKPNFTSPESRDKRIVSLFHTPYELRLSLSLMNRLRQSFTVGSFGSKLLSVSFGFSLFVRVKGS